MVRLPQPKVERSFRSSISLQVTRDGEILVKAPYFAPNSAINRFLLEKEEWILKSLQKVGTVRSRVKQYKEGEYFCFLGEEHMLTFYDGIEIKAENRKLLFPKALQFRIQKELPSWFVQKAKEKIMERLALHSNQMQTRYGEVLFSDTKSKWGTCFADNS